MFTNRAYIIEHIGLIAGQSAPASTVDGTVRHHRDSEVWQTRLGEELTAVHADVDADVLAAARALLAVTDPGGTRAGKYTVTVDNSDGVQVGDNAVHVDTSYGTTAGTMSGPVSISYCQLPIPPARPAAG